MKLHFDNPYTDDRVSYQKDAIEAVCGLFHGQETCRTEFTVTRDVASGQMSFLENDLGIGNRLTLLDDELLANLHAIQLRHGLAPSASLASGDFTVEMETGTGKTYVYLRTVFELNKRYGFTKFVIVVPSVHNPSSSARRAPSRPCASRPNCARLSMQDGYCTFLRSPSSRGASPRSLRSAATRPSRHWRTKRTSRTWPRAARRRSSARCSYNGECYSCEQRTILGTVRAGV
jgi:Rad3-related DNA helicase